MLAVAVLRITFLDRACATGHADAQDKSEASKNPRLPPLSVLGKALPESAEQAEEVSRLLDALCKLKAQAARRQASHDRLREQYERQQQQQRDVHQQPRQQPLAAAVDAASHASHPSHDLSNGVKPGPARGAPGDADGDAADSDADDAKDDQGKVRWSLPPQIADLGLSVRRVCVVRVFDNRFVAQHKRSKGSPPWFQLAFPLYPHFNFPLIRYKVSQRLLKTN